jgi:predicted ATPase
MIKEIQFKNFKALRDTTLPLSPFTLIVGPNGSGKSTALQALELFGRPNEYEFKDLVSINPEPNFQSSVFVRYHGSGEYDGLQELDSWPRSRDTRAGTTKTGPAGEFRMDIEGATVYRFDTAAIAAPVTVGQYHGMDDTGRGLAAVLDRMRDERPEKFDTFHEDFRSWFPEYDRILFNVPELGKKAFSLRVNGTEKAISAENLSAGTLLSLALLTLSHLENPPSIIGLEEPDHGIHPRLLRRVQDALYRLAYPREGSGRKPVQVIATTHSPYFLDLFKDHPEEIVIADKTEEGVQFRRLADEPHIQEVLGDAALGEVWYSGVLGGIPVGP